MSSAAHHAQYAACCRLFGEGQLQACRSDAESLLSTLSRLESESLEVHQLFSNTLLLVANVYSAIGGSCSAEADRLLATCYGYVKEHVDEEEHSNIALASIAYNRAVLRLEQERLDSAAAPQKGVHDALHIHLREAERRLQHTMGLPRLLLADVWHCMGACHHTLGDDFVEAVAYYHKSMEVRMHFGDANSVNDLKLALTMEHVAQVYRMWGRGRDALQLLASVVSARRAALGPQHALYASTLLAYGTLALELGKVRAARAALEKAAVAHRQLYDPMDWRVAEVDCWIAQLPA